MPGASELCLRLRRESKPDSTLRCHCFPRPLLWKSSESYCKGPSPATSRGSGLRKHPQSLSTHKHCVKRWISSSRVPCSLLKSMLHPHSPLCPKPLHWSLPVTHRDFLSWDLNFILKSAEGLLLIWWNRRGK